jgi:hypothetical protein
LLFAIETTNKILSLELRREREGLIWIKEFEKKE